MNIGARPQKKKMVQIHDHNHQKDINAEEILNFLQNNGTINIEKTLQKMKQTTPTQEKTPTKPENIKCKNSSSEDKTNKQNIIPTANSENETIITIKFEGKNIKDYRNYLKLHQEIDKCNQAPAIKSAYINNYNQLIIKTTEIHLHKITNKWPSTAFTSGIKKMESTKTFSAAIYNVDNTLELEDEDLKTHFNQKYNIIKTIRIMKKKNNESKRTIQLIFNNEEKYKHHLEHGIYIGYTYFRLKKWHKETTLLQCYKCLKLGHHQN